MTTTDVSTVQHWLIAVTGVVSLAIILGAIAFVWAYRNTRTVRSTMCCYESAARRHEEIAERTAEQVLPLLSGAQPAETTMPLDPVSDEPVDEHPTGRHALTEVMPVVDEQRDKEQPTAFMPATGEFRADPPPYYFAGVTGDEPSPRTVVQL